MSETKQDERRWRCTSDSVAQVHGEAWVTNDPTESNYPHEEGCLGTSDKPFIDGYYWWRVDWNYDKPLADFLNALEADLTAASKRLEVAERRVEQLTEALDEIIYANTGRLGCLWCRHEDDPPQAPHYDTCVIGKAKALLRGVRGKEETK